MIKAVIFDRDGVLINTEDLHIKTTCAAFEENGILLSEEDVKGIVARNPVDYLPELKEKYKLSNETIKKIFEYAKEMYLDLFEREASLAVGAKEIIEMLKNKGTKMVLATSADISNQLFLEMYNFKDVFWIILERENVTERKPNPEIYLKAVEELNMKKEDILVIEDSEVGVEAAKNAGLTCIAIRNKYTNHEKADYVVNNLVEAGSIIEKMLKD